MSSIPDPSQTAASAAAESLRSEEIQRQLKQLGGRDLQLWSIGILIIVVLVAGFAAVVAPGADCPAQVWWNIAIYRNSSLV